MRKQLPGFLTGLLIATIICTLSISALAAAGQVSFNLSPIQFNGQQISAAGEDYTLDNGCKAPSSITYTDEKGGGTTYLPARRIAELMGVGIGYDAATGSVTVESEVTPADTTPAPDTTALSTDYSDWSPEEEAAYQEFKGVWDVDVAPSNLYPDPEKMICGVPVPTSNMTQYNIIFAKDKDIEHKLSSNDEIPYFEEHFNAGFLKYGERIAREACAENQRGYSFVVFRFQEITKAWILITPDGELLNELLF